MYVADYHTPSSVSPDGSVTVSELAQAAIDHGLDEICVTDHVDTILWGSHKPREDFDWPALQAQVDKLRSSAQDDPLALPWVKELLALGHLTELDRPTVAAAIREIRVYEGNRMEIDYLLPESCRALLEG